MKDLTPLQRKYLKGLAHSIDAIVILGKSGLTESLTKEIDRTLASHELIKVKFNKSKDKKSDLGTEIAEKVEAALVSLVGNHLILYRKARRNEDRKIKLPASKLISK